MLTARSEGVRQVLIRANNTKLSTHETHIEIMHGLANILKNKGEFCIHTQLEAARCLQEVSQLVYSGLEIMYEYDLNQNGVIGK